MTTPTPGFREGVEAAAKVLAWHIKEYAGATIDWNTGGTDADEFLGNIMAAILALPTPQAQPEGTGVGEQVREQAAKIADTFTCGICGMDGKAGAAIRAMPLPASPAPAQPAGDVERVAREIAVKAVDICLARTADARRQDFVAAIDRFIATALRTANEIAEGRVVYGFYEDRYPFYTQGKDGWHELTSPITAEEANGLVKSLEAAEAEIAGLRTASQPFAELLKRLDNGFWMPADAYIGGGVTYQMMRDLAAALATPTGDGEEST